MAVIKKKKIAAVPHAILHVTSTLCNTFFTLTRINGEVLSVISCGLKGFTGTKKNTPHALEECGREMIKKMKERSVATIDIVLLSSRGASSSKNFLFMFENNVNVLSITDKTSRPHNGTRLQKSRSV